MLLCYYLLCHVWCFLACLSLDKYSFFQNPQQKIHNIDLDIICPLCSYCVRWRSQLTTERSGISWEGVLLVPEVIETRGVLKSQRLNNGPSHFMLVPMYLVPRPV
jgi:hypothetical protein